MSGIGVPFMRHSSCIPMACQCDFDEKVVLDLIPTGNGLRPGFAQPVGKVVLDLIPTGNGLRPGFAQPVGKVVLDLIPTGNGLRPGFAQPVGKVVCPI
jgi:hypothetical protein